MSSSCNRCLPNVIPPTSMAENDSFVFCANLKKEVKSVKADQKMQFYTCY